MTTRYNKKEKEILNNMLALQESFIGRRHSLKLKSLISLESSSRYYAWSGIHCKEMKIVNSMS